MQFGSEALKQEMQGFMEKSKELIEALAEKRKNSF